MRATSRSWAACISLLALCAAGSSLPAAQITQAVIGNPGGAIDHIAGFGLGVRLYTPLSYSQSDGNSWNVTGGSESLVTSAPASVIVNGSSMTFSLQLAAGSQVFYGADSGTDAQGAVSTEDRLFSISPILLQAQIGSATATTSGYLRLTENSNVQSSLGFSPFATPVGSIIPFQTTYTILGGQTWTTNFESLQFNYLMSGTLDVTRALAPGDANGDGKVDFADLTILAQNYGRPGATWFTGDFNGDGIVDFPDLVTLAQNYGYVRPTFTMATSAVDPLVSQVPEPSAGTLLGAILISAILCRWRKHTP